MLGNFSGDDRDWIAQLFDLAMAEMRRRRPDLRAKSESEIIEILTAEHGPAEHADLADPKRLFMIDFSGMDKIAKSSGRGGLMPACKTRSWH